MFLYREVFGVDQSWLGCNLITPGFEEADWFKSGHYSSDVTGELLVVVCLSFCRRNVPDGPQ